MPIAMDRESEVTELAASTQPLDVERVRRDFPILSTCPGGKPLVYLDNAATSQKPQAVLDAITDYYFDLMGPNPTNSGWIGSNTWNPTGLS